MIKTIAWVSCCLCAAALEASGADKSAPAAPAAERFTWGATKPAAGPDSAGAPKKSRLKYRTADGTCACTCASGGTTEEEIRKAEEARERARS